MRTNPITVGRQLLLIVLRLPFILSRRELRFRVMMDIMETINLEEDSRCSHRKMHIPLREVVNQCMRRHKVLRQQREVDR
jgi:hypothetical protein